MSRSLEREKQEYADTDATRKVRRLNIRREEGFGKDRCQDEGKERMNFGETWTKP